MSCSKRDKARTVSVSGEGERYLHTSLPTGHGQTKFRYFILSAVSGLSDVTISEEPFLEEP